MGSLSKTNFVAHTTSGYALKWLTGRYRPRQCALGTEPKARFISFKELRDVGPNIGTEAALVNC